MSTLMLRHLEVFRELLEPLAGPQYGGMRANEPSTYASWTPRTPG